jgi:dimethyladenosine transferase 1
VDIIHGDALEVDMETVCHEYVKKRDWEDDPPEFHVIGNLPFNVSIPLLLQWLAMIPGRRGPFSFGRSILTLTFQREVAERIVAPPGHTQRSRLSIMTQNLCHVHWGFTIPGSVFTPSPKVDAVVLKLVPRLRPLVKADHLTLERVVKALFTFRRKFIKRGASLLFPTDPPLLPLLFSLSGVPHTLRAQQLTMEQVDQLSSTYLHLLDKHSSQYAISS